jgi:hypothetical protein
MISSRERPESARTTIFKPGKRSRMAGTIFCKASSPRSHPDCPCATAPKAARNRKNNTAAGSGNCHSSKKTSFLFAVQGIVGGVEIQDQDLAVTGQAVLTQLQ